jgi:hypothetical protein
VDIVDAFNLISAVVSSVLAVVALYLAIVFFRMSSSEAERSQRSADEISASVKRLEALFSSLYADTFSMMRETVANIAQEEIVRSMSSIMERLGLTEEKLDDLRAEVTPVVHNAIEKAQAAVTYTDQQRIAQILAENGPMKASHLLAAYGEDGRGSGGFRRAMLEMIDEKLLVTTSTTSFPKAGDLVALPTQRAQMKFKAEAPPPE